MLTAIVTATQRRGRQAKAGDRNEVSPIDAKQAGGIAWNNPPDGIEKACVAVAGGQRRRQIARYSQKNLEGILLII